MNRAQIINELRQYVSVLFYHQILELPTPQLEILLQYYKMPKPTGAGATIRMLRPLRRNETITVGFTIEGIDRGLKPDYVNIDDIREPLKRVMTFKSDE